MEMRASTAAGTPDFPYPITRLHLLASRIGGQRPDAAQDPLEALRPLPPVGPDEQVHVLHIWPLRIR